ncbi:MAG TPA: LemA family protein [Gammaproteobacteria bacterium]|nr:LemA family protein [Gammaproteobacteria bacterium]
MLGVVLLVALGAAAVWAVWIFNRLIRYRNGTRAGWSDIDVQLQRRHDLIPRLVETVRGYAGYERATLEAVTELRTLSRTARGPSEKARIEQQIETGAHRLLALAESYPDLKANRNFLELQKELVEVEDHLQHARRFYNGAVRELNTRIESFPDLLVARPFGFREAEFFEAEHEARAPVAVALDGGKRAP